MDLVEEDICARPGESHQEVDTDRPRYGLPGDCLASHHGVQNEHGNISKKDEIETIAQRYGESTSGDDPGPPGDDRRDHQDNGEDQLPPRIRDNINGGEENERGQSPHEDLSGGRISLEVIEEDKQHQRSEEEEEMPAAGNSVGR